MGSGWSYWLSLRPIQRERAGRLLGNPYISSIPGPYSGLEALVWGMRLASVQGRCTAVLCGFFEQPVVDEYRGCLQDPSDSGADIAMVSC